jgi:steroid delta-isomerase-like uncharacterized protein
MSAAANKRTIRDYYATVLNQGDVARLDGITVADYVEHDPLPGQGSGREGLKRKVEMLRDALASHYTIEEIVAEGETVAVRWTSTGIHRGEILGIPATGRTFSIAGVDFHLMRDGLMAEHWHVVDQLGFLQQLGIVPAP